MKQWKINLAVLALPVLLMVGCAAPAYVEKDDTADFTQYKTFAWVTSESKDNSSESKDKKDDRKEEKNAGRKDDRKEEQKETKSRRNDLMDKQVQQSVNKELEKQGWKEDKSRPDVLISYDLLVERNTRETTNPVYSRPYSRVFYNPYLRRYGTIYYPSTFLGYDDNAVSVREGTLTVTMVDAKSDHTIWQGWTTDEVANRNVTQKEIQASVRSIFRKFDVVSK